MSVPVLAVERLGKRYRIGARARATRTLRDVLADWCAAPWRRLRAPGVGAADEPFWALRDVSFQVQPGEAVGVIGSNGAGKSTLLKILARITEPTTGQALLRGRVRSLLEVGTGFHPELTGRENIFLNGALLGMPQAEIRRKFGEIVAFAEVERFLDTPVKRYSSGMYVRLAFAVAAHLEPEILLIDEVLAVGDVAFQRRCLGKMGEVAAGGRTILFVSHNMSAVRSLCSRALWLDDARLRADGRVAEVIPAYLAQSLPSADTVGQRRWEDEEAAPGGDEVRLRSVALLGGTGRVQRVYDVNEPIEAVIEYRVRRPVRGMRVLLTLLVADGAVALVSTDHDRQRPEHSPGVYRSACRIPARLLNTGTYSVMVAAGVPGVRPLVPPREILRLQMVGVGNQGSSFVEDWPGAVCPRLAWEVRADDRPERDQTIQGPSAELTTSARPQ